MDHNECKNFKEDNIYENFTYPDNTKPDGNTGGPRLVRILGF